MLAEIESIVKSIGISGTALLLLLLVLVNTATYMIQKGLPTLFEMIFSRYKHRDNTEDKLTDTVIDMAKGKGRVDSGSQPYSHLHLIEELRQIEALIRAMNESFSRESEYFHGKCELLDRNLESARAVINDLVDVALIHAQMKRD